MLKYTIVRKNNWFLNSSIDLHTTFVAPVEDGNDAPSPTPLLPGERKKRKEGLSNGEARKKEIVPSPLMGEGQDEVEN